MAHFAAGTLERTLTWHQEILTLLLASKGFNLSDHSGFLPPSFPSFFLLFLPPSFPPFMEIY